MHAHGHETHHIASTQARASLGDTRRARSVHAALLFVHLARQACNRCPSSDKCPAGFSITVFIHHLRVSDAAGRNAVSISLHVQWKFLSRIPGCIPWESLGNRDELEFDSNFECMICLPKFKKRVSFHLFPSSSSPWSTAYA